MRVTHHERAARAARLLGLRLTELAAAAERATSMGEPLLVRRIELAHMSTEHAIDLHLISQAEAEAMWRDATEQHPALAHLEGSVIEEAAAALPAEAAFGEQLA